VTLADLASIGALVNGVAVLVSLIYLNLQTRQTARNQQSLMQHGRAQQLSDWLQYIAHPEIADVMVRGNDGRLEPAEFVRYHSVLWSILLVYENNFVQHRSGMLDDRQYEATLGSLRFQCSLPGFRANWITTRHMFDREFAVFVDDMISKTPVILDIGRRGHTAWAARAAQEAAKASPKAAEPG
jgi:hypothetical protein